MRSSIRKGFVQRAFFETLEARQLLSVSPTPNEAWEGSGGGDANGGNDYVAPGMSVPSNAAEFDGATMMQGSQTISLTLSNLPSHTLLSGYHINIGGVEGTFNVSIDGVVSDQMTIGGGTGGATWEGGMANEGPMSSNASHTSDSLTITVTAQLSDESDYWQVSYSRIDVNSYVAASLVQTGSMEPGDTGLSTTPGVFSFSRSNNDGPASSDQPLNVYYTLDHSVGDVLDDTGLYINSVDGSAGEFYGPTIAPGQSDPTMLVATIPAGQSSVNVNLTPTILADSDDVINGTTVGVQVQQAPDLATEVGYTSLNYPNDWQTAVPMAARNQAVVDIREQVKGRWEWRYNQLFANTSPTGTTDTPFQVVAPIYKGMDFHFAPVGDQKIAYIVDPTGTLDGSGMGPKETIRAAAGVRGQKTGHIQLILDANNKVIIDNIWITCI